MLTLIGGATWGLSGTCGQYIFANSQMDSGTLAAIRMIGAGVILILFCFITRKRNLFLLWKEPLAVFRLILFAVGGLMFTQFAYLTAIRYSNSGTATVFQNTGIILVMVVSCIVGRRWPKGKEILAAVLTLIGVFFLATHGKVGEFVISRDALLWGGLAAIALMSYTLLPGKLLDRWGTPVVNGFAMLIGGSVITIILQVWKRPFDFEIHILLALFVIVVFGTVLSFTFYLQGVADIGPVKASMLACVEPVVATVVSALWLGTKFQRMDVLGFLLIIGSCMLISLSGENHSKGKKTKIQEEYAWK